VARPILLALGVLLLAAPSLADRLVTSDGRVLEPKKARPKDGGGWILSFEHGEVILPDGKLVKAVEVEGDMSDYVPQNDDEREKLAQGFVRYEGRWYSKSGYEQLLKKRHEASKKRADEMALHSEFKNGWTKESKHFALRSNTSPELVDGYIELLETYYDLMDKRFSIKVSPSIRRSKMEVNVYKNRREFTKLTGVPPGVAGFFNPNDMTLNFYHDYQEPSISQWVALHEGTHLLTHLIDPQYIPQIWLNEAVADYFGSAEVTRDAKRKLNIVPGKVQTDRVLTVQLAIQEKKDIALADLFEIDRSNFQAFEYAHAWSFVYFLNETAKYKKGFDRFFKDIYTLAKGIEFENALYGKTGHGKLVKPGEIRRVVMTTIKGDNDDSSVRALDEEWKAFIGAVPVEGAEARFKRAYRAVFQGQIAEDDKGGIDKALDAALADLDFAIEQKIADPRAWWARSRILAFRDKRTEARKDLEEALAQDPLNAVYHFDLGTLMIGGPIVIGFGQIDVEFEGSLIKGISKAPEAKRHLGLASELAPDNELYRQTLATYLAN
jgi:tetratricopeptide (TPR) repeat protein